MGWLGGWFGSGDNAAGPLGNLDPKLREFLERESPVKLNPPTPSPSQQPGKSAQTESSKNTTGLDTASKSTAAPPAETAVPRESLFQDGRYAHLWKTYKPLAQVEAETKTDHEKLTDVLDGFKARKALIGRAALENCADEQLDWNNCMKSGDWASRMTMCRAEVKKFEKCYTVQSKLLKALGYLSSYDRPEHVNEEMQMHADKLYHQMLEQEEEIDKAKAEGREPPKFEALLKKKVTPEDAGPEPGERTKKKWQERLEKLPEQERAAEQAALEAEHKAKTEMVERIEGLWQEQAKEREARKTEGKETMADKASKLFGWK